MITGANQGIGWATAERFEAEGSTLCLVDRDISDVTRERFGDKHHLLAADLATSAGMQAALELLRDKNCDVLINNAGITRDATITKMTRADWDKVIAVNLTAVFELCQGAAVMMKERGSGVILNASSVVAHNGNFGQTNYAATKAGVIAMTQTLARELGRANVRVNAVAPGFIETPMTEAIPEKVLDKIRQKPPLARMGHAHEIAAAYAFLASDEASYITGTTLNVDGGLVLG
nr:SDR family oxidoreductase [Acanthopleuribacter pedis]